MAAILLELPEIVNKFNTIEYSGGTTKPTTVMTRCPDVIGTVASYWFLERAAGMLV